MNLKWKKIRNQGVYINSSGNVMLRQEFAVQLMKVVQDERIIINFDESIISGSTGRSHSWERRGAVPGRNFKSEISGLSILCAVSSKCDIFFQFMDGNNNQVSV